MTSPMSLSPSLEWSLEDWYKAVHISSAERLLEVARHHPNASEFADVTSNTIRNWNRDGLRRRTQALAIISVLTDHAREQALTLFSPPLLREHARVFLSSRACRDPFAELRDDEAAKLAGQPAPPSSLNVNVAELRSRLRIPPPSPLIGRQREIRTVLDGLDTAPIVALDGEPGIGKTALAWHAARTALENGQFTGMDWVSAERSSLQWNGQRMLIKRAPVTFDSLTLSLCQRFNWYDLTVLPLEERLPHLRSRLGQQRRLLVVDDADQLDDSADWLERLRHLLTPEGTRAPLVSRALLTARTALKPTGSQRLMLTGLTTDDSLSLIQQTWAGLIDARRQPLSHTHALAIATVADGNPQWLIQATGKLSERPRDIDKIMQQIQTAHGFNEVFTHHFDALLGTIHEGESSTRWLLETVAISDSPTQENHLLTIWEDVGFGQADEFWQTLTTLADRHLLRRADSRVSVAPILRAYIQQRL